MTVVKFSKKCPDRGEYIAEGDHILDLIELGRRPALYFATARFAEVCEERSLGYGRLEHVSLLLDLAQRRQRWYRRRRVGLRVVS